MSLPIQAVDRIFKRLSATYGASWDRSLGSTPVNDAKSVWEHELSGFGRSLQSIAWALENLPERCPNVIEFRNLCRKAPQEATVLLPEKIDPERVAAELLRLGQLKAKVKEKPPVHAKDWARSIKARQSAGEKMRPIAIRFADEALRFELEAA